MEINLNETRGVIVVSVTGSIDSMTFEQLSQSLALQVEQGNSKLVLDMENVDFMSSAGLRAILSAMKLSRQDGGDLRIAAAQERVGKILSLSGFTSILKSYNLVGEAVESYQ